MCASWQYDSVSKVRLPHVIRFLLLSLLSDSYSISRLLNYEIINAKVEQIKYV